MKNILLKIGRIGKFLLITAFVVGVFIGGGFAGMKYGEKKTVQHFHEELITRDFAEYNTKTGVWQYKSISDFFPMLEEKTVTLIGPNKTEIPLPPLPKKSIAKK